MTQAQLIRRIRCGNIEAVVTVVALSDGQARYGVFFQRLPTADDGANNPFYDFGELLTLSKLARLAHTSIAAILSADDED